jgi:hypothetical protein
LLKKDPIIHIGSGDLAKGLKEVATGLCFLVRFRPQRGNALAAAQAGSQTAQPRFCRGDGPNIPGRDVFSILSTYSIN